MKRSAPVSLLCAAVLSLSRPSDAAPAPAWQAVVDREAARLQPTLVATRRDLHQHPELSNREERTARVVAERLRRLGLEVRPGVARHGVVALLKGGRPGPVVALRADMDALPIEEANDVPYRSRNPGVMHACGHDAHTAIGLGVAELLAGMRDRLPGSVKFLFQPAEEGPPAGEEGGASLMIREGALENPRPAAIFGLHVTAALRVGQIGAAAGGQMAAVDNFEILIHGKKSHGAYPQDGIDAVVVGAQVVANLQSLASRVNDARDPLVVTVGIFEAGNRENIIADRARLAGTIRTLNPETRAKVKEWMGRTLAGVTSAYGATFDLNYRPRTPVLTNDAELVRRTRPALERVVGAKSVVTFKPQMGGEDFAYYQEKLPGLFLFLGVGNPERGITHGWHTPQFDLDEAALPIGVRALASAVLHTLETGRAATETRKHGKQARNVNRR